MLKNLNIMLSTFLILFLTLAATLAISPLVATSVFAQTTSSTVGNCIVELTGQIICVGTATGLEASILKGPPGQCYPHFNPTKCNLIQRGDAGFIAVTQQVQIISNCKPDSSSEDTNTTPIQTIVQFGGVSNTEVSGGITVFKPGNDRTPVLQIPGTSGSAAIEGQLQTTTCSGNQVQIGPTIYRLIGSATFTLV